MNEPQLLAIRVSRRAIGFAVFSGLTLDCTFVRELPANDAVARKSTIVFLRWALDTFGVTSAVVEAGYPGKESTRRDELSSAAQEELATNLAYVASIAPEDVLAPPDRPRRRPRKELREIALELWPELAVRKVNPVALDAAVLGLHQQTILLLNK